MTNKKKWSELMSDQVNKGKRKLSDMYEKDSPDLFEEKLEDFLNLFISEMTPVVQEAVKIAESKSELEIDVQIMSDSMLSVNGCDFVDENWDRIEYNNPEELAEELVRFVSEIY